MPSFLLRCGPLVSLLCLALTSSAQADLSVHIAIQTASAQANQPIKATIYLDNEGDTTRRDLVVGLRMSAGLFFVEYLPKTVRYDESLQQWTVSKLDSGRRDSFIVVVQPNIGGVHVLTAELMTADKSDWDSTPGNGLPYEDDQDEVCISVPIQLDCGQEAVLRAPRGRKAYTWYRNDTALVYATSDTLHPQGSGAYRFVIDGETCASGNCCPVIVERTACLADVALLVDAAPSSRGKDVHRVTLKLFNEGSGPISRIEYYLTSSAYLRLADQTTAKDWQITPDRMRRSHRVTLFPGDSATVQFDIETIGGGAASAYRMFAEVSAFYAGDTRLVDVDSDPDEDPTNDAIVDGGRHLARTLDEDDSDIVVLGAGVGCSFDVLAKAGYSLPAQASGQPSICIAGARNVLTDLTYTLDGVALKAPTQGCDAYKVAKFSLRDLPANYADNGWRIDRYEAGGQVKLSSQAAATLAEVVALLRGTDPKSEVRVIAEQKLLEIEGYTAAPTRLRLRHVSSSVVLDLKPVIVDGFRGWGLTLPAGLSPKQYNLIATNAAGCTNTANVTVLQAAALTVIKDTLYRQIEVAEPLFLADTKGFDVPLGITWTPLASGYMTKISAPGRYDYSFARTDGEQRYVRTYRVDVQAFTCVPSLAKPSITLTTESCDAQTVPLGLTSPGLQLFTSNGSVYDASRATGTRPGASYALTALADQGLTETYTVTTWPGLPAAEGLKGNAQEIVAQLRRAGKDVSIDWTTGHIRAAGTTLQAVLLRTADGRSITLPVAVPHLQTFGTIYLRPGIAVVTVAGSDCKESLTAELKCKPRVIIMGGGFVVEVGNEFLLPLQGSNLPGGYALRTDTWKHENPTGRAAPQTKTNDDLTVRMSPDSTALIFLAAAPITAPLTVKMVACNDVDDCVDVVYTITTQSRDCGPSLWASQSAEAVIAVGDDDVTVALPAGFDASVHSLTIDGRRVEAIAAVDQPIYRTYPTYGEYKALRTPFGKTIHVAAGNLTEAMADVFEEATIKPSATEVSVEGLPAGQPLYGQRPDDTWGPVKPLAERVRPVPAIRLGAGTHVLAITGIADENVKCTDTMTIVVRRARVANRRETLDLTVGEKSRFCLPASRQDGVVIGVDNNCLSSSGERIGVEWDGDCLVMEAYEAGQERVCLTRRYLDGGVDSIMLVLRSTARLELDVAADRDTLEFGQFKVIEVLRNDKLADEPLSLSLVSEPFFGRAQVVGNAAIEYLHYGADCAKDIFTYEVCQGDICDSTTVELMVYCDELLIYNGMSPNGDGVNEEFTILGLGQYPKHQLSIFNRSGNLLIEFREYANDWRGDIGGAQLAEGTYFYVIDLGNGESRSGYLQLSR